MVTHLDLVAVVHCVNQSRLKVNDITVTTESLFDVTRFVCRKLVQSLVLDKLLTPP